jgi:hypothetical protein
VSANGCWVRGVEAESSAFVVVALGFGVDALV